MDFTLDSEGRLSLPAEVRERLGWKPGQKLHLHVDGDQLLVQPASASTSLRDEARRLADGMRHLAGDVTRQVADAVGGLSRGPEAAPALPAPGGAAPAAGRFSPFAGVSPRVPASAYVAPEATVIGDVSLGEDASVWPGAVLRGDVAPVRVGARTNIQDGAVLHVSPQLPCVLGSGVTVGHQAAVHACRVGDDTLIGIHAVILDGATIGSRCIVAAGAVVPPGAQIPDGKMVMGVPAKVVRDLTPEEIERVYWNADSYASLKAQYQAPPAALSPPPAEAPAKPLPPRPGTLPRYACRRAPGAIEVDGSLDDAGWAGVPALSPLVQAESGDAPAQATEVKACWDDRHLYVAFACKDNDVWGTFENRDDPIYNEEVVELFLCPTGNLQHYFEIEVSPLNVLFDAKVFSPEGERRSMLVDREWNGPGIRTAVRVAGDPKDRSSPDFGWIAEVAVPFADLGLAGPPAPGTVWRANFYRIERGAVTEFTAWSPSYREPADFHVPASFGELVFVNE